ncbi:nuclear transport factor 2 family protein [Frateuria sp. GZRR35]|uniref:nuclear transport factor 2 family protein n=1 Tax=unclassified Frateuria TaxID=2648894 RepID=UPI003EDB72D8
MTKLLAISALAFGLLPIHAWAACGTTDPTSTATQVVQAQVDAYNAHDTKALAACYAADARLVGLSGTRPPVEGRAAIANAYASLFASQPKAFGVEILKRTASGAIVVDLERVHGMAGDKPWPDAFAVYEVRDGLIVNAWFPPTR